MLFPFVKMTDNMILSKLIGKRGMAGVAKFLLVAQNTFLCRMTGLMFAI